MKLGDPDRPSSDPPLEGCPRLGPEETMAPWQWQDDIPHDIGYPPPTPLPVWHKLAGSDKSRPVDWGTAPRET